MAKLIEKKKLSPIPKVELEQEVAKFGLSKALTVGDIKIFMELKGIADKYTWKQNTKGYWSAWR